MSLLDRIISVEGLINTLRMKVVQAMNIFKSKNVVSYKVYSALLTQSGTDAPVATILENTIGDIVWTRTSLGNYDGTLSGAFPSSKLWLSISPDRVIGNDFLALVGRIDNNTLQILSLDRNIDPIEMEGVAYIEIRVYITEVAAQTIPDILGNTGKYLRTDGSTLSWDSPNIVPTLQDVLTNGSTIVSDATIDSTDHQLKIVNGTTGEFMIHGGDIESLAAFSELQVGKNYMDYYAQTDGTLWVESYVSKDAEAPLVYLAVNSDPNKMEFNITPTTVSITKDGTTTYNLIPPKRYVALLTQTGTGAPVATVLENTIGNIVWTRVSAGTYEATLAGAFTIDKTVCPPFDKDGFVTLPIGASTIFSNAYQLVPWTGAGAGDKLRLTCYDAAAWTPVEMSDVLTPASLYIKIEVYP